MQFIVTLLGKVVTKLKPLAANGLGYWQVGGCGLCLGAGPTRSQKIMRSQFRRSWYPIWQDQFLSGC